MKQEAVPLADLWFDSIWTAALAFPENQPLILLGGRGSRYSLVGLSWDEISWNDFIQEPPTTHPSIEGEAWTTGHLAVVSYEGPGRVLHIKRTLVIDHSERRAHICSEADFAGCAFQIAFPPEPRQPTAPSRSVPLWQSPWTDASYQNAVRGALEDIRRGRYYQINLLRYWFSPDPIPRAQWLQRLVQTGGPFSAYIDIPKLQLVSFSPERFFRLGTDAEGRWIETEPIKGTRPVSPDPIENQKQIAALMASGKDAAELNMIVDLLRNDLYRVSQASSVKVLDPGSLHSFANVHHRIARIRGRLRSDLTLAHLLEALCPGGSITGAPKREVMQAIREKEGRTRGWFMGNIMYKDSSTGRLDSSILIRTAVRAQHWEFAAGSGIVIHSDPAEELAEVRVKAKVLPGDFV